MTSETFSLNGKNAVVTGAGTGIGRAIALAFARGRRAGRLHRSRTTKAAEETARLDAAIADGTRSRCAAMSAAKTT